MVMHQPIRGLESSESLKESVLPIGLVWNPQNGTIFLNAQAGNLQLMDPNTNSMLFNVCETAFFSLKYLLFLNNIFNNTL